MPPEIQTSFNHILLRPIPSAQYVFLDRVLCLLTLPRCLLENLLCGVMLCLPHLVLLNQSSSTQILNTITEIYWNQLNWEHNVQIYKYALWSLGLIHIELILEQRYYQYLNKDMKLWTLWRVKTSVSTNNSCRQGIYHQREQNNWTATSHT